MKSAQLIANDAKYYFGTVSMITKFISEIRSSALLIKKMLTNFSGKNILSSLSCNNVFKVVLMRRLIWFAVDYASRNRSWQFLPFGLSTVFTDARRTTF